MKVYPFSVGEPDAPTPAHIIEAAKAALDKGATRYTAVTGTAELKAAICEATARERGHRPKPAQVTVSVGAKHALFNLACALYEPGDEVIIPAPYWVSYPEQVRLFGATPVIVETSEAEGFRASAEAIAKAVTPRTKAIILCTPSNPTGSAYTRAHLEALADVFRRGNYYVVVDEIYGDLVYDGFEHVSLAAVAPDLGDRLVIIDGVSKTYAMTGWRIGWSITSTALASQLATIQGQSTTNPAAVSQAASVAALNGPRESVIALRDGFARKRVLMVEGLRAIPGVSCRMPEGAFYAFADVRQLYGLRPSDQLTLADDGAIASWFLDEAHAASVAGGPFGAPGYIRFSYACSDDDIRAGTAAIAAAVKRARGG
ncbi:MAG: pyridoxal phosphate-dependent aminotransferase [Polyangiaceae bacterium]